MVIMVIIVIMVIRVMDDQSAGVRVTIGYSSTLIEISPPDVSASIRPPPPLIFP